MQGDALLQAAERAYGGDVASDEDSSDEDDAPARAPLNAFALLGGDDSDEADEVRVRVLLFEHPFISFLLMFFSLRRWCK